MHIVHGELRKAPYIKPGCGADGQSTMFIIELSEMIKDRQAGENNYTNYSAAIFAKSPAQIDYYTTSLVEGNYVVVNCEKLKVDVNESNGKQYIKLQMENARLEGAKYVEKSQGQQGGYQQAPQQQRQQGGYQAQQEARQLSAQQAQQNGGFNAQGGYQAPQQGGKVNPQKPPSGFDDDIPF